MDNKRRQVQRWLRFFAVGLLLRGLTAIPVEPELRTLQNFFPPVEKMIRVYFSDAKELLFMYL